MPSAFCMSKFNNFIVGRQENKKVFRLAVDKIADFDKFSDYQSKNFLKFGKI